VTAMELVLALDAGTTGIRAVAFDRSLREVDAEYRELTQFFPAPGWVEHDANEISRLAVEVLGTLARRQQSLGHHVVALGITNQRESTVAFDRARDHVDQRVIVWQDRRGVAQCEQLKLQGVEDDVRRATGLVLDPYFSATKMHWLSEHGALSNMAAPSLSTIDAFLIWTLSGGASGGCYVTEPSNASRTSLFDISTLTWSSPMCELFGVAASTLPDVRASVGHFATVSGSVIGELADVAITGVLGDQQAALCGQACFSAGMIKATYGTGAFVLANAGTNVPVAHRGLLATVAWDLGEFGPVTYALEGAAFVAGAAVQWLRDELGFIEHSRDLESLALSVPNSGGVIFVPAFSGLGSPFWRADARGSISGLTRGTTRAHIARALLNAQAFQVRAMTDAFVDAGVSVNEVRADGGVAAMNSMLELQAGLSRLRVRRSTSLEATARGAASVAMLGAGIVNSTDELNDLWTSDFEALPSEDDTADAEYASWLRAVQRN
jgi:glycerol kinase